VLGFRASVVRPVDGLGEMLEEMVVLAVFVDIVIVAELEAVAVMVLAVIVEVLEIVVAKSAVLELDSKIVLEL